MKWAIYFYIIYILNNEIRINEFSENHRSLQTRAKSCLKLEAVFFYDVSELAKCELSIFNSKSKSKAQNLPKHNFSYFVKNYQMEYWNAAFVYSDIFTMVTDIVRQIMEKFSTSQMAWSWERNLASVINLSGTQKWSKHQP